MRLDVLLVVFWAFLNGWSAFADSEYVTLPSEQLKLLQHYADGRDLFLNDIRSENVKGKAGIIKSLLFEPTSDTDMTIDDPDMDWPGWCKPGGPERRPGDFTFVTLKNESDIKPWPKAQRGEPLIPVRLKAHNKYEIIVRFDNVDDCTAIGLAFGAYGHPVPEPAPLPSPLPDSQTWSVDLTYTSDGVINAGCSGGYLNASGLNSSQIQVSYSTGECNTPHSPKEVSGSIMLRSQQNKLFTLDGREVGTANPFTFQISQKKSGGHDISFGGSYLTIEFSGKDQVFGAPIDCIVRGNAWIR